MAHTMLVLLGVAIGIATSVVCAVPVHQGAGGRQYVELASSCEKGTAVPVSGLLNVSSVAECEVKCDEQAAAAPGTGSAACTGLDTNGHNCYLKSTCDGKVGKCRGGPGDCGYRLAHVPPPPPPPPPAPPVPPSPPGVTLRQAAARRGVFIGAATNVNGVTTNAKYKEVEQAQFSLTTAENACKVGPIHPERDTYNWKGCDTIFDEAEAANQTVRGHNLCWHNENPGWLNNGKFKPAELIAILQEHIDTVVKHYGTRAYCWDVVNEALDDHGLKPSKPWYPAVPTYIDIAFQAARKAGGKQVKLFYNDFSAEGLNPKSEQVYKLVKGMQARGVPIDGVGLQFHWSLGNHDSLADVAKNMARLGALGLEVHITELDIKCVPKGSSKPCTPELLQAQGRLYADILQVCLDAPTCKSFESWGFTDADTWIGTPTHPLPFDENYKAKPAVAAMINLLLANDTRV